MSILFIDAFSRPISSVHTRTKLYGSSLGDLFSGVLGVAPSSLTLPTDILAGTSIDPARDDVELGRVYKVSHKLLYQIRFTYMCHAHVIELQFGYY